MRYNRYNMENMEQQAKIIRLLEMANSEKHYPSCEMDCIDKRDIIFNRSGLACRMLELLQTSIIPENVYQMKYLNMAYDKFEKKKSVLFSKQELFDV